MPASWRPTANLMPRLLRKGRAKAVGLVPTRQGKRAGLGHELIVSQVSQRRIPATSLRVAKHASSRT